MLKSKLLILEYFKAFDEMQEVDIREDIKIAEEQLRNGQFMSNMEARKRLFGFNKKHVNKQNEPRFPHRQSRR
ncbi:MAG TPA: hypothetical protein VGA99_02520 [bacterium]